MRTMTPTTAIAAATVAAPTVATSTVAAHTLAAQTMAPPKPAAALPAALADTRVSVLFDDGSCLLGNGMRALRAVSCLVELQVGDRVLASVSGDGLCHVLHILMRCGGDSAGLSVPGARSVALRQSRIAVHAVESIDIGSAGDASLSAAGGTLSLNGRNLFTTVSESLVEQAGHYVGKFGQYLLDVRQLLRLHGNDALLTATSDIKVDAERISMG